VSDLLGMIVRAAKHPAGQAILAKTAQQFLRGRSEGQRLHWGRSNEGEDGAIIVDVGSEGPYVSLGALARVGYITQKGIDSEPTEYRHTFQAPLPWLYKNGAGDLVIVRGVSKYSIKTHGIIG
jgi:hypothetical protein